MKKLSITIGICLLFASCQKEEYCQTPIAGDTPIPSVKVSIIDKQGNDLLNPNNPSSYNHDNIELYADSLTTIKRCENWELNFRQYENPPKWFILIRSFADFKKYRSEFNDTLYCATSYLKLNDTTTDVIYSEYAIYGHVINLVTALYNGEDLQSMEGTVVK